jgi:hypothetical protein
MIELKKLDKLEDLLSKEMEIIHGHESYVFRLYRLDVFQGKIWLTYCYKATETIPGQFLDYIEEHVSLKLRKIISTYFNLKVGITIKIIRLVP